MRPLHPGAVPKQIVDFHRALLSALRVDYIAPGLAELNNWKDFLFVMRPLDDTPGGPFTVRDIAAVVGRMRTQNQSGGNWSLRFSKIIGNPETFRDLVLETRRSLRKRPPPVSGSRTAGNVTIATESDPAADSAPQPIEPSVKRFMDQLQERKAARERKNHDRQNQSERAPS